MFDSLSYAALEQRRCLAEDTGSVVNLPVATVWGIEGCVEEEHVYLLLKNESHGERDSLEKQQHAENTEELQGEEKTTRGTPEQQAALM